MNRPHIGILLVAHGSHLSPDSATPVHALVRRIAEIRGDNIREVRAAFWKEEPELRSALDLMECREVIVVPIFTSAGYFTEKVVPRELRLDGPVTLRGGRRIRYSAPVGVHPGMAKIALARAQEAVTLSPEERSHTTLVIVGHGTDLHPGSEGTTQALVKRLQGEGYQSVVPSFLDQEPKLDEVLSTIDGRVVVVPFFISEGWHAGTTIPRDLRGFDLHYARAMGTHPEMAEVVCEIVEELVREGAQGIPGMRSAYGREEEGLGGGGLRVEGMGVDRLGVDRAEVWEPLPVSVAREAFVASCLAQEFDRFRLLQIELRRIPHEGRFELRHIEDWHHREEDLRDIPERIDWNALATRTASGAHRPLRSAPDLERGWRFRADEAEQVWEFLDALYPGALRQMYQRARGELPIVSFREIAFRQTGIHARVGELTESAVGELVQNICAPSRCLRAPIWHTSERGGEVERSRAEAAGGSVAGPESVIWAGELPCPEPCSIFITAAAKRVASEE